jgi:hypothetical protein
MQRCGFFYGKTRTLRRLLQMPAKTVFPFLFRPRFHLKIMRGVPIFPEDAGGNPRGGGNPERINGKRTVFLGGLHG